MPADHHAVIVGIAKYPAIGNLKGPHHDAEAMRRWMLDPGQGDVDPANLKFLCSVDGTPTNDQVDPVGARPNRSDMEELLRGYIVTGLNGRVGQRLYIYVAGHGFGDPNDMSQTALFSADAQPEYPLHFAVTAYADWFRRNAVFDEVVVIADCCRGTMAPQSIQKPQLLDTSNPGPASRVRAMYAYATGWGQVAREREVDGVWRGIFTMAILNAFEKAKANQLGNITGSIVKKHVHNVIETIAGDVRVYPPEIIVDDSRDIVLLQGKGQPVFDIRIRLGPTDIGATVSVFLGPADLLARAQVAEEIVTFQLAAGYYKVELDGTDRCQLFEVVGTDVEIAL